MRQPGWCVHHPLLSLVYLFGCTLLAAQWTSAAERFFVTDDRYFVVWVVDVETGRRSGG